MKVLIYGAGPLGSLYAYLLREAGNDVTVLARNKRFNFLKENGVLLENEFTQEKFVGKVNVVSKLSEGDHYDLVIVIMRKNSVKNILPILGTTKNIPNILFMGNTTLGFDEFLKFIPRQKVLFGFPGGGGSLIDQVAHYIDSEKPNGSRMPVILGEIDGTMKERTEIIKKMFEAAQVPVNVVSDIDSWLKYHVAFINPLAGALLKSGDNYKLAEDKDTMKTYIRSVIEGVEVLKSLGYTKSYNPKLSLFKLLPEFITTRILSKVFNSKFSEVAMMMHINSASDEMRELGNEFKSLIHRSRINTPNIDELISYLS